MPFRKGWNRWSLPQDTVDADSMKLTMVHNSWSLPMFQELMIPGSLADMDYNDIMISKNRSALQETLIVKALFMYTMMHCAPNLRATKPDLLGMYNDIMHDRHRCPLKKCSLSPRHASPSSSGPRPCC